MKSIWRSSFVAGLILASASPAMADHLPNVFQMLFPVEDSYVIRSDRIGAGTYESLGASWTVNDYDAQIAFDNMFLSTTSLPYLILEWHDTGAMMPLSVTITSTTAGTYNLVPIIQPVSGGIQDFSLAQYGLTGNIYFGQHIPDAALTTLRVELVDRMTVYDLTIDLAWGPSVPNDETSWDRVKSLYR
jgi:hypothetical protein